SLTAEIRDLTAQHTQCTHGRETEMKLEAEANAAEKAFCDQGHSEATLIEPSSRIVVVGVAARMHLFRSSC
ncbi:MAG: hypothetical protein ACKPKO_30105, partial [Candidatus Fonsibacter sp.]